MGYKNTLFNQILQFVPRLEFQKVVDAHDGDKKVRALKCWGQFVTLLFGQITGHNSLKSMTTALNSQKRYFYHLGIRPVRRSTLSDANEKRNPKILEGIFYKLLNRTQSYSPKHKFRFKGRLLALDSTTINLCLTLCPWAQFRKNKGAFKLHTAIDLAGNIPQFMVMSTGKVHDIKIARKINFIPGSTVMMDKAYIDYGWLNDINSKGIFFVTRMKDNCQYKVRKCSEKLKNKGICADQEIRLTGAGKIKYPQVLRRISYKDRETGKHYEFLTNRFDLAAKTICDLYKSRWEVELFFKTLKGQLQVDKFVGTSENAVLWQVWTALIAYLLVSLIRFINRVKWSIPSTMAVLAVGLFQNTDFKRIFFDVPLERCVNIRFEQQLLFEY